MKKFLLILALIALLSCNEKRENLVVSEKKDKDSVVKNTEFNQIESYIDYYKTTKISLKVDGKIVNDSTKLNSLFDRRTLIDLERKSIFNFTQKHRFKDKIDPLVVTYLNNFKYNSTNRGLKVMFHVDSLVNYQNYNDYFWRNLIIVYPELSGLCFIKYKHSLTIRNPKESGKYYGAIDTVISNLDEKEIRSIKELKNISSYKQIHIKEFSINFDYDTLAIKDRNKYGSYIDRVINSIKIKY
jgi:hypothetical protein